MEPNTIEHFSESAPERGLRLDRWLVQAGARVRERFARAYDWLMGLRRVDRRRLMKRWQLSLAMLALLLATSGLPIPAHAAGSMIVDPTTAGGFVTDGKCSLAKAIVNANAGNSTTWTECAGASTGGNTITLPANTTLNYATALGTGAALPDITSQITIQGNGSTIKRDSAASTDFRILNVNSGGNLTLNLATISGGKSTQGAGIWVYAASATITNSTIAGNLATGNGGGIFANGAGTLTLSNSTVSGNTARNGGGLGFYQGSITLSMSNSTISGNTATGSRGGGIYSYYNSVNSTLTNCTITGNTAKYGGGGGIWNSGGGGITLVRTIVAGNSSGSGREVFQGNNVPVTGDNFNLFGDSSETNTQAFSSFSPGASDINATSDGTNTPLASILNTTLANNGGPTQTHNLASGSPAIDKIQNATCAAAPVNGKDQRGYLRPSGAGTQCDIGAVEFGATPSAVALSSFKANAPFDFGAWLRGFFGR